MKRTYELVLIADPRLSDEDAATLVDEFRNQLTADENTTITVYADAARMGRWVPAPVLPRSLTLSAGN